MFRYYLNSGTPPSSVFNDPTFISNGGEVVVEGVVNCYVPVTIPSNTMIRGEGTGSGLRFVFDRVTGLNNFYLGNRNRRNPDSGDVNITLKNLWVEGVGGTPIGDDIQDRAYGLSFRKVKGLSLEHCRIVQIPVMGVLCVGCDDLSITHCEIMRTGRDGLNVTALFDGSNHRPINTAIVSHCMFQNIGDDSIAFYSCSFGAKNLIQQPRGIVVCNNSIIGMDYLYELSQGRGIVFCGVSGIISANAITNTPSNGICIYRQHVHTFPSSGISIVANVIDGAGTMQGLIRSKDAIYVKDQTSDFVIGMNTIIRTAGKWDINISESQNGRVYANRAAKTVIQPNCVNVLMGV